MDDQMHEWVLYENKEPQLDFHCNAQIKTSWHKLQWIIPKIIAIHQNVIWMTLIITS
jgi:lambda repressor-like predicted transcriptional regulator